jgi:hypothetical protein
MRSVRRLSQLALTLFGTLIALYAVLKMDAIYERVLVAALGLLIMQLGVWQITSSLMPNQREFLPLRKETDYFLTLVRLLNRAVMAAEQGSEFGQQEVERLQLEMHHSVDRMRKLAGRTEEGLGFRYRPQAADAHERLLTAATHRQP